jgi:hypothetical protein
MVRHQQSTALWPSTQLLLTADCPEADSKILEPRSQLKFLTDLGALIGPELFAESLVYSTSRGNTGWTALRMGRLGHVTYHHWDVAAPNLLQLDLFGIGTIDDQRTLSAIEEYWTPLGIRVAVAQRTEPTRELTYDILRDDLSRRSGKQVGLGPGDHLHLMLDQTSPALRRNLKSPDLDQAILRLVDRLKMRGMTPVMRHDRIEKDGFAYDAIVGITTSHISVRLRQSYERIDLSLDVFSCRKFDVDTVLSWLDDLTPNPTSRRAVLYNRHPKHEFTFVGG